MIIFRNEISKISVFLPKKAGGALRESVTNFVPGKSGFFLYNPVLKTEKKGRFRKKTQVQEPHAAVKKKCFFIGKNVLGPGPGEKSNKSWGNFVKRVLIRGKFGFFARPGGGGSKNRNGNSILARIRISPLNPSMN